MNANGEDHTILRRYLLGSLAPESSEGIEKRLFSEDQIFWERVRDTEDALIDDYLWDELDSEEREQFERHFLRSADRRSRVEFARALRAYARGRAVDRPRVAQWLRFPVSAPAWVVAAAAVLLLTVLPGVGWRLASRSVRDDVSVRLPPSSGRVRGAGTDVTRVLLPERCQLVRLELDRAPGGYKSYRATLHEVTGEELWSQSKLVAATTAGRADITLTLPCELLSEGDYHVRLQGLPPGADAVPLDRYDFRVLHQ